MPYTFAGQPPGVTKWLNEGHASAGSRGVKCAGLSSVIESGGSGMRPPSTWSVHAPAVTTTVSARTAPAARVHRRRRRHPPRCAARGLPADLAAGRDDPPLELLQRCRRSCDPGIRRVQHGVFEPHAVQRRDASAPSRSSAGMPRARSCSWIAISPPPVPPRAAPAPCETRPCRRRSGSPPGVPSASHPSRARASRSR